MIANDELEAFPCWYSGKVARNVVAVSCLGPLSDPEDPKCKARMLTNI